MAEDTAAPVSTELQKELIEVTKKALMPAIKRRLGLRETK